AVSGRNAGIEGVGGTAYGPGSEYRHRPIPGERRDRLPGDLPALLEIGYERILRNVNVADFHPQALRPTGGVDFLATRGEGAGVQPKAVDQIEIGLRRDRNPADDVGALSVEAGPWQEW